MKTRNGSFWLTTVVIALAATMIVHAPMLIGRIPFPADLVLGFPPYAKVAPPGPPPLHGDIGDLVMSFYPYRTLLARAAREGTLPFWNPYMMSGSPFVASAQSAVFYPPNWLYCVLPVTLAWAIGFVLRRVLAMLFTVLFARRIGCSQAGAICAGLLFSFCGFMTGWQGSAMADTAIWLPLISYSIVRLRDDLSLASIGITALAFAMPVLAGHPETAAHLTLTGVLLAAVVWPGVRARAFAGCFAVAGLLSLGLAAIQVLPTLEWLRYIYHGFDIWPLLTPWKIVALISRDIIRPVSSIGLKMPEEAAYVGMIALVAAPLSLRHRSRRLVAFWILGTVLAMSTVYGAGPGAWLAHHLPGLKSLKNARMILIFSFGLSVLAGFGISWLEELAYDMPAYVRRRAAALVAIGVSAGCALFYLAHIFADEPIEYVRLPKFSFFLLAAGAAMVMARLTGMLGRRAFRACVIGLTAFDVVTVSYGGIPHARPKDVFPRIELFDQLPKDAENPYRIGSLSYAYGTNFELPYGLSAMGGYELSLRRLKMLLFDITRNEMDSVMLTTGGVLDKLDRRIDMLNVKYIIVTDWDSRYADFRKQPGRFRLQYALDDTEVYENLRALPAAFLIPALGAEVIPDEEGQLQRVKDPAFDPARKVVLGEKPPETGRNAAVHSSVRWVARHTNDFELDIETDQPSILVISQTDYPGWRAYVDSQITPITTANYALPAVFVSTGRHHVRFVFISLPIRVGLILSVGSAGILAGMLFGFKKTERTRERLESTLQSG